jgi:hypothetical protein
MTTSEKPQVPAINVKETRTFPAGRDVCPRGRPETDARHDPQRTGGSPRLRFAPKVRALARASPSRWQGRWPAGCRPIALAFRQEAVPGGRSSC